MKEMKEVMEATGKTGKAAPAPQPLTPQERGKSTMLMRWALVNMFLTMAAAGLTLFIWLTEQDVRSKLVQVRKREKEGCEQKVIKSAVPQVVDPEQLAPPQDTPRSGYIGSKGTDITPVMVLSLEALRDRTPEGKLKSLHLGAHNVLPPSTIHIVNLWATWCGPCKDEMPDFKAMFERHAEWGDDVRFVPILVKDSGEPRKAYNDFASVMPPAAVKLADRSYEEALVKGLAPDESLKLFHGNLPVTLVLDCNRRVRWARFEQLTEADFAELESYVATFRAELADTSHGAWCTQTWAGNGRCEGAESSAAHHSLADCGELKRRPGVVTAPPVPVAGPALDCPPGMQRGAEGRCVPRLKGTPAISKTSPKPTPASRRCGDGKCEAARGESNQTCCQDCACASPLVCKADANDQMRCQVKGLK